LSLKRTVDATIEPVTLTEAKAHVRVTGTDEDTLITSLIIAARQHIEDLTGRAFIQQTWVLKMDQFPADNLITLPRCPALSVTSIGYVDTDGNSQTVSSANYQTDLSSEPARIFPDPDASDTWPGTDDVLDAVTVTYTAGYGTSASSVPQWIKQAVLLLVGHWYENREAAGVRAVGTETAMALQSLMWQDRVFTF